MITTGQIREQAAGLLKRFYGYDRFRPGQAEVIEAVASGRDALVLMPTGGGKSICYQIPALMSAGCAVVVSPLIALMEDQTAALVANGIPAAAIHSNRPEDENRAIVEAAFAGKIKLLYISPERLLSDMDLWLGRMDVSLFAIDEAHCISQWGHDFRPTYTKLSIIKQRFPSTPMMALTATADRLTRDDIATQLGLREPLRWTGSFARPNLSLRVVQGARKRDRVEAIRELVRKYPNDSGIVYTLSRSGAEEMHKALSDLGILSAVYHAGLDVRARNASQRAFTNGDVQVICATVAFGMGIDKSNIRWVVHNNLPGNIESYYQEIGRAGRDGLPAETILFYSYQDVIRREKFIEESGQPQVDTEKLEQIRRYAEGNVCRRRVLLNYFGEEAPKDCGNCDVCLHPPVRFDGTVLAQKAASAVVRTNQRVGIFTLTDILRGSARAEIHREGFDKIRTYGAGRDVSAVNWNNYIVQMIQLGLFDVAYDHSNHLRVTPMGWRVLRGEQTVMLAEPDTSVATGGKTKSKQHAVPVDPVQQLFEQLKSVRKDIAAQSGIPAFVVFSDATLLDMAQKHPLTYEEFKDVSGVGERKAAKYGRKFIGAIRKFDGLSASMPEGSTYKATLLLHNAGLAPGEIAQVRELKAETVLHHIARLIDEDLINDFGRFLSRQVYTDITTAMHEDTPVPDDIKEKYSSGTVDVALAVRRFHQRRNG